MIKKESIQFNVSVEGANCERMYFEHLAKLVNSSNRSTYNLKVDSRKMSPMEYGKRNAHKPAGKQKGNKKIPYIHVQDIEDYYDDFQKTKFFKMIDEIRMAEKEFGIIYKLGYSNYTFELWMLLHVVDMTHTVQDRHSYLVPVNRWFRRNYTCIDEFKRHDEFSSILNGFVTLDSIKLAISRAERIVQNNIKNKKTQEHYKGFTFFRDNPDVSVHQVIQMIFDACGII